jgi:hypothetical protein
MAKMYQEARRGRVLHMQTLTRPGSSGLNQQSRRIGMLAILLFALSGLISGFALGAFVKPKIAGLTLNSGGTTPVVQGTKTPTSVPALKPEYLYYPKVDQSTSKEFADGQTFYTFSAHATDVHHNRIHTTGITCKLWLTKDKILPQTHEWRPVTALNMPIAGEIPNSLLFDQTTSQIQQCDGNGQATWKYQVSSTIDPGDYYLAVITDWAGVYYNIWWQFVIIKKAN